MKIHLKISRVKRAMRRFALIATVVFAVQGAWCGTADADTQIRPGFSLACTAVFEKQPVFETSLVHKKNEYWLRYDIPRGAKTGCFRLFVRLDDKWRSGTPLVMPVELGKPYRIKAGWTGREVKLSVNGVSPREVSPTPVRGNCCGVIGPVGFGRKGVVKVTDFTLQNTATVIPDFSSFKTRELMVYAGQPSTLEGTLANIGAADASNLTLVARGPAGVTVSPATQTIASFAAGVSQTFVWTVNTGTNGAPALTFSVVDAAGRTLASTTKRQVALPSVEPDFSAKGFQPPIAPVRTYYVDADAGDDTLDGLSPATAWRTFANVAKRTLGPGERLLLKRGCVFHDELIVKAVGSDGNWAEIGAYGEGMRPQINRRRRLDTACARVAASHLAVRDLVFCHAGSGLLLSCGPAGHILVERCLAHHIEGQYRFNSHGIPEWRGLKAPDRRGINFGGSGAHHLVLRDCEMYQCTSGFGMNGTDTAVHRVYCHDSYAHNTSPHPVHCAHRSYMTDCVFDASGWQASCGTMGIMLARNEGLVIRGCHFLNQPDSGSPDEGGIDFENMGENVLIDRCTFRNNAGAAIEVLGLRKPQTRNVHIRGCRFDRNNWAHKNGPAEIPVWGKATTPDYVACSNGRIEGNGYVLAPDVAFYLNETRSTNDWTLVGNRAFDFAEDLDAAFPYPDPPAVTACGEIWTDRPEVALFAKVGDPKAALAWEQQEGTPGVVFASPTSARTRARFPGVGDYRVFVRADNGTLWRTARTAVHILPPGARTVKAWDFSRNLDVQGWQAEETGAAFEKIPEGDTKSLPVKVVCGGYYVIAVKEAARAAIVTPDETEVGVPFGGSATDVRRANTVRIRMHNHTTSRKMRLWWQTDDEPTWSEKNSVAFDVTPQDADDRIYDVPMPTTAAIKQFKLAFSADGTAVTGTVRLDYIWLGSLPSKETD